MHNEELHNLYPSPNIIRVIKSRRIDEKIILQWILGKWGGKVCTGCIWLRIGTSSWLL
jgi:hypothetical protein